MRQLRSTSDDLRIRVDYTQKVKLQQLAKSEGFSSISEYARHRLLGIDLTLHQKLNAVLNELAAMKQQLQDMKKSEISSSNIGGPFLSHEV